MKHYCRMQKRIAHLLVASCFFISAVAQQAAKTTIAPFKMQMVNGKSFTYTQLKKDIPTILVYFSPTCDHCKAFTEELMKHTKELAHKQVVMISYEPLNEIKKFDELYKVSAQPAVKIGTEGYTFIVQKYYGIQRFPFIALYNKQMKLVKILPDKEKPEVLVQQIAQL